MMRLMTVELDEEICDLMMYSAARRDISMQELLRRFLILGTTVDRIEQSPDKKLFIATFQEIDDGDYCSGIINHMHELVL